MKSILKNWSPQPSTRCCLFITQGVLEVNLFLKKNAYFVIALCKSMMKNVPREIQDLLFLTLHIIAGSLNTINKMQKAIMYIILCRGEREISCFFLKSLFM